MSVSVASHVPSLVRGAIRASTQVTFPYRELKGASKVLDVAHLVDGKVAFLFEATPFHPVDRKWPDQPSDRGTLIFLAEDLTLTVEECEVWAIHKETQRVAQTKEVPKGEKEAWAFVVAHIADPKGASVDSWIGEEARLEVDAVYREDLSLQHTACHLAAFALNRAAARFWSKAAPKRDSLNAPHLDQLAIENSSIFPNRAEDRYRFGKSIQKSGFQVEKFFQELEEVEKEINQTLAEWIATRSKVEILAEGPKLDDFRRWHCQLPVGLLEVPCGGSHVQDLSVFSQVTYRLHGEGEGKERHLLAVTQAQGAKGASHEEKRDD